ncbi:MAG TPA: hypothetical protein VJ652_21590 [Noviherbaspirillum sp.]|nr:hypothetical protein [Noviherbaspirillum sp.]
MTPQDDHAATDAACEPRWVALNHLFSYCARAGRPPARDGEACAQEAQGTKCARRHCLFGAPRGRR